MNSLQINFVLPLSVSIHRSLSPLRVLSSMLHDYVPGKKLDERQSFARFVFFRGDFNK